MLLDFRVVNIEWENSFLKMFMWIIIKNLIGEIEMRDVLTSDNLVCVFDGCWCISWELSEICLEVFMLFLFCWLLTSIDIKNGLCFRKEIWDLGCRGSTWGKTHRVGLSHSIQEKHWGGTVWWSNVSTVSPKQKVIRSCHLVRNFFSVR